MKTMTLLVLLSVAIAGCFQSDPVEETEDDSVPIVTVRLDLSASGPGYINHSGFMIDNASTYLFNISWDRENVSHVVAGTRPILDWTEGWHWCTAWSETQTREEPCHRDNDYEWVLGNLTITVEFELLPS